MMNYNSAAETLIRAGYKNTNKCHFEGVTYHDFTRKGTTVSLVIDELTGAVSKAEVTKPKWSDESRRYVPVKEVVYGLQDLKDRFAPKLVISF
jgi:hypothetical protein